LTDPHFRLPLWNDSNRLRRKYLWSADGLSDSFRSSHDESVASPGDDSPRWVEETHWIRLRLPTCRIHHVRPAAISVGQPEALEAGDRSTVEGSFKGQRTRRLLDGIPADASDDWEAERDHYKPSQ
jgi:hypothetical protein